MSLSRLYLLALGLLIAASGEALALKNGTGAVYCLPGEKQVCASGPPPVCHCEALRATNKKDRGTVGPTGVSGTSNSNSGKSKR